MTLYRSKWLKGLTVGVLLGVSVLAPGCAMFTRHSPYEVFSYKDTNRNGRYDSADVEYHDVRTNPWTGAKTDVKLGKEARKMKNEMTIEEIKSIPLEERDETLFSE
jgi:hypothetical protein